MKIKTRDFGIVDVDEESIYEFPEGVYGFEANKRFAIFEQEVGSDVTLIYLQSVDNPVPCFLVFDPTKYCPAYAPEIAKSDLDGFSTSNLEDLVFLVIASVPESVAELSLNMKSPVILDPKTKTAKQVILKNTDYAIRYQPFKRS